MTSSMHYYTISKSVYPTILSRAKKLLQRTGAMTENMVAVGERWAIVQHRLFANRDEEQSRKIAEAYLSNYGEYATTELSVETMVQLYPFHPGLFTTLKEIYAARTQQGIRDTLRTLADLVVMHQDKHDLLLVSDVPADKLLSIDPDLHTALQEDIERCQGIKNADALLSTIFFYSLRPRMPGATTEEVVQSLLRPSGSINGVIMPLQDLDGRAFHLQSNGRFQITPDMNVYAVVRAEVGDVEDEDAKAKIDKLLTDDVFGGQVNLLSELDEVDDRRLKVVIAPHDMTVMRELDFSILAVAILKHDHLASYGERAKHPYHLALEFMLERFVLEVQRGGEGSRGHIIAESRGEVEDDLLKDEFFRLKSRGSYYQSFDEVTTLWTEDKRENIVGLQIADLVAYPIARKILDPAAPQLSFDVIRAKVCHKPGQVDCLLGYGIKIFPEGKPDHYFYLDGEG